VQVQFQEDGDMFKFACDISKKHLSLPSPPSNVQAVRYVARDASGVVSAGTAASAAVDVALQHNGVPQCALWIRVLLLGGVSAAVHAAAPGGGRVRVAVAG
jgi:hypothetical protein